MKRLFKFKLPALTMIMLLIQCNSGGQNFSLPADEFAKKLDKTPDAIVLDVRTPKEFNEGYIKNAQNIDFNAGGFKSQISALDKTKPYFVYCLSGGRSKDAANYMRKNGFVEVYDMKGGLLAWKDTKRGLVGEKFGSKDKVSMDDYNTLISKDNLVLVDFYAPWCGPCRKMEPMLNEVVQENKGKVTLVRLNIDENKQLARQLGVREIPVLKIYNSGKEIWTHNGLVEKPELTRALFR